MIKSYYIDALSERLPYTKFIDYMVANSDAFSVVYFKYHDSERTKKSTREMKKQLEPYKLFSCNVYKWPGTETENAFGHIYRLAVYRCDEAVADILKTVDHLYAWNYPAFPMDLAFYRDGYAWFSSCAHEWLMWFYTNDVLAVEALAAQGLSVEEDGEKDIEKMFLLPAAAAKKLDISGRKD